MILDSDSESDIDDVDYDEKETGLVIPKRKGHVVLDSESDSDIEDHDEEEAKNEKRFHPRRVRLTNLDKKTTTEMIRRKLHTFGEIEYVSNVCEDQYRENSCFAFVTFSSSSSCDSALSHERDVRILGRKVMIGRAYEHTTVYMDHLPRNTKENNIRSALQGFDVNKITISGNGHPFAVIDFANEDERLRALRQRFVKIGPRQLPILPTRPEQKTGRQRSHWNNNRPR